MNPTNVKSNLGNKISSNKNLCYIYLSFNISECLMCCSCVCVNPRSNTWKYFRSNEKDDENDEEHEIVE